MADGRNLESICGDCSTPNPTWASLNRGVVVCDDCCAVHRSLGRHISYIKSLHSTNWSPAVREMVSSLVRKGANSIWEHALRDSASSKVKIKKPSPRDKVHPNKHDFIVAKYKHLALLPRLTVKETANTSEDLSKQLHASVRTSNLETCLRLLSMGADPNYLHSDRGNTPLHVAAHANQAMQVELLVIYGANPSALDLLGHTPEECARIAGHHQLADRLVESQYELTDRLCFFLCGRKPVHSSGEHYLIPQGIEFNDSEARNKLQQLSNEVFEELVSDIFDEVDRRETDAIWLTTLLLQDSVAFLPVNPAISPMRNQGRQKLATLDSKEFCQLVTDVLLDTKRRQNLSLETGQRSGNVVPSSGGLVPEHDYDDVAMEEDNIEGEVKMRARSKLTPPVESTYSIIGEDSTLIPVADSDDHYSHLREGAESKIQEEGEEKGDELTYSSLASPGGPPSKTTSVNDAYSTVTDLERPRSLRKDVPPSLPVRPKTTYDRVKGCGSVSSPASPLFSEEETVSKKKLNIIMEQLRRLQKEKDTLEIENERLNTKVADLQKQLNKVITENVDMKSTGTPEPATPKTPLSPVESPSTPPKPPSLQPRSPPPPPPSSTLTIPSNQESVYSEVVKKPPIRAPLVKTWSTPAYKRNPTSPLPHVTTPPLQKNLSSSSIKSSTGSNECNSPAHDSSFIPEEDEDVIVEAEPQAPPPIPRHQGTPPSRPPKPINPVEAVDPTVPQQLPPLDSVHNEIKAITICIQELLKAGQAQQQSEFSPCSKKIIAAVDKLISMFPPKPASEKVDNAVKGLAEAIRRLKSECQNSAHPDKSYHTRLVMNSAYDVAKAARFLVTCVEGAQ